MDCKRYADDLTAYLDGELSSADSELVRSHLQTCVSCSEELRGLREIGDLVASHSRNLEPRPESWSLVRARINESKAASLSGFWFFGRPRLAVAALAVFAAFGLGYVQYQQVQKRNLDRYMLRYVKQREAQMQAPLIADPYANNPFIEVKATVAVNPFRSEDR